jgi:arginyl-tRNA--protein-N-Asp/Glu arginylyltransferase
MMSINRDIEFFEDRKDCSYFDDKLSDTRYKIQHNCDANTAHSQLIRGWRRFGKMSFVPECIDCDKCVSMRIDVKKYHYSKSEKRVFNKNKNTEVFIQEPSVSYEHLDLYAKYHKHMRDKKGWNYKEINAVEYYRSYVDGHQNYGKEILYMIDGKLVGVALCDFFSEGISSVYCYYDHDYEHLSLGKFSILAQIQLAKNNDIPYIYLGYWIKDHFSMGYKEAYKPFEYLVNRPSLEETPIWREYE